MKSQLIRILGVVVTLLIPIGGLTYLNVGAASASAGSASLWGSFTFTPSSGSAIKWTCLRIPGGPVTNTMTISTTIKPFHNTVAKTFICARTTHGGYLSVGGATGISVTTTIMHFTTGSSGVKFNIALTTTTTLCTIGLAKNVNLTVTSSTSHWYSKTNDSVTAATYSGGSRCTNTHLHLDGGTFSARLHVKAHT